MNRAHQAMRILYCTDSNMGYQMKFVLISIIRILNDATPDLFAPKSVNNDEKLLFGLN